MFVPPTIAPPPPTQRLSSLAALSAMRRNLLELWPQSLYEGGMEVERGAGRTFVTLASPDLAQRVLLDEAASFGRSWFLLRQMRATFGAGLFTTDGEAWRSQRRITAPAFRPQALHALVPGFAHAAQTAADHLVARDGTIVDILEAMTRASFDVALDVMMGVDDPDIERDSLANDVATYLDTFGRLSIFDLVDAPHWMVTPRRIRGLGAARRLRAAAERAIARKAAADAEGAVRKDLSTLLLNARDESGRALDRARLIDNVLTFTGAGHETVAVALTWTLYLLALQPDLQDTLAAETATVAGDSPIEAAHLDRLVQHTAILRETMRLFPPAPSLNRTVHRAVDIGGIALKPGDHVTVAVYPMHRQASYWSDPDAFDPDRFAPGRDKGRHRFQYLPFGAGPNICIGLGFAMMEAVTLLATMLRQVRVAPVPGHRPLPVVRITLRPADGMPLIVTRR